jgi:uncharacterized integral membrane protein
MKKSMFAIWAIIVIFLGLVITQNQDFFLLDHSLRLNLWVLGEYNSPSLPAAVTFLLTFIFGLIIAYLLNLPEHFRSKRSIKKLNATIASHLNEISALKKELDTLKGVTSETGRDLESGGNSMQDASADETVAAEPAGSAANSVESPALKTLEINR